MPSDGKPADVSDIYWMKLLKSTAATCSMLDIDAGVCVRGGLVVCDGETEPTSSHLPRLPHCLRPRQRGTSEAVITEVMQQAEQFRGCWGKALYRCCL